MKFKSGNNNALTGVATVAGMALGAVLGILFAPRSGRDTRSKLNFKRLFNNQNEKDLPTDQPVEELWEKTRDHAMQLQEPENKRKDPLKIKVPSAGTTAWKEKQIRDAGNDKKRATFRQPFP